MYLGITLIMACDVLWTVSKASITHNASFSLSSRRNSLSGFSYQPRLVKPILFLLAVEARDRQKVTGQGTIFSPKACLEGIIKQNASPVIFLCAYDNRILYTNNKAIKQRKINGPSSTHANLQDYNSRWLLGKYVTKTTLVELCCQEANALRMQAFSYMCN